MVLRLGLIHPSEGSNEGSDTPAPIASIIVVSCQFECIKNIVFRDNELVNYVEKL